MVKEITAFQADDGTVFGSRYAAAEHDVRVKLKALNIFNEGSINAIVQHGHELRDILATLPEGDARAEHD